MNAYLGKLPVPASVKSRAESIQFLNHIGLHDLLSKMSENNVKNYLWAQILRKKLFLRLY